MQALGSLLEVGVEFETSLVTIGRERSIRSKSVKAGMSGGWCDGWSSLKPKFLQEASAEYRPDQDDVSDDPVNQLIGRRIGAPALRFERRRKSAAEFQRHPTGEFHGGVLFGSGHTANRERYRESQRDGSENGLHEGTPHHSSVELGHSELIFHFCYSCCLCLHLGALWSEITYIYIHILCG